MSLLRLDAGGWIEGVKRVPSPNFDARPPGEAVTLVVIHNISLPPGEYGGPGILELFTNRLDCAAHPYYEALRDLRVSAHFLIRRDGELVQFVSTHDRAWHAGVSCFRGRERCNDFSIGIELEGSDFEPFTDAQYTALSHLLPALAATHPIRDIAGHADIAPGRKTDPGPFFDWSRLPPAFCIVKT
ncbi:1,6-anhydro-N-acetylmuramyl-L-alanine amidase AmpD [Thiobacter aerophilum]|uniref:1,6-anhydro-N-acetylmuramyl-L-alanine amidase AmpD n=1 Tax=Thiobacter aerophilum TaxID=3121275 RepID=A0ABV0EI02_9BURK